MKCGWKEVWWSCSGNLTRLNDGGTHLIDLFSSMGFAGNDGDPQSTAQFGRIDPSASLLSDVPHIQHKNRGQTQVQHLADDVQIAFEVGSVRDANHHIDRAHIWLASEQDFHRNHLVDRSGRQAVSPRKIDQLDAMSFVFEPTHLLFDGHSGIVSNPRMDSCQSSEKRAFPRIGVSDHRDRSFRAVPRAVDGGSRSMLCMGYSVFGHASETGRKVAKFVRSSKSLMPSNRRRV